MAEATIGDIKRAKSLYKGVFRCGKKFKAQIQTNGVQNYLGLFDTEIEAARAYDTHARTYLGSRAKTNFKYDTPAKAVVQPRPVVSVDDTLKQSRNKPVRNAKRVYVGIKVRCNSHNDLTELDNPSPVEEGRQRVNTMNTFNSSSTDLGEYELPMSNYTNMMSSTDADDDDDDDFIITKDDLFIVTDSEETENSSSLVSRKRRRSTGNITPKELITGASQTDLDNNKTVVSSDELDVTTPNTAGINNHNNNNSNNSNVSVNQFGTVFDDGLGEDWANELLFLTESMSMSFDATLDDQISQAILTLAADNVQSPRFLLS